MSFPSYRTHHDVPIMSFPSCTDITSCHHVVRSCRSHHVVSIAPLMYSEACLSIMSFKPCRFHHVAPIMYSHLDRLRYSEDEIIAHVLLGVIAHEKPQRYRDHASLRLSSSQSPGASAGCAKRKQFDTVEEPCWACMGRVDGAGWLQCMQRWQQW